MSGVGLLIVVVAYFAGSIPFGYLIGRWRGIDVRQVGSGNIGATNVVRAAGRTLGGVTFLLDGVKGAVVPVLALVGGQPLWVAVGAGFAAMLGHCFSAFLSLQGGKGVATFVGAFAVVDLPAALAGAAVFVGSLLIQRYVAVSSMAMLVTVTAVTGWRHGPADARTVMAVMSLVLVGFRHRENWARLRHGTEEQTRGRSSAIDERQGGS